MNKKASTKEIILIGSMLFGLFFGAGNLIFPIQLGQNLGNNFFSGTVGFLLTAVGFPFLGIIAIALSGATGVFELAGRVNQRFAYLLTILLYLTIGPIFALPRLAAVSFEIAFSPYISESFGGIALLVFSILFYAVALYYSFSKSGLMNVIGKRINPLFLLLLFALMLAALWKPMGRIADFTPQAKYDDRAFTMSFIDGYQTMDALAALAFGIIIINALDKIGIEDKRERAINIIKAGAISVTLMTIVYTGLIFLGASSLGKLILYDNGGVALANIVLYYFRWFGHILVALIVVIGCLKTAIGLINACSESFSELMQHKYPTKRIAIIVASVSCLVANFGLSTLISLSVPVLMFIYPLVIALIFLGILSPLYRNSPYVYQAVIYLTMVASVGELINALPDQFKSLRAIDAILNVYHRYVPLFDMQMGWVSFLVIGFIIGIVLYRYKGQAN